MESCFVRELEINDKILRFYQNEIGNVSCVVWDAALVLAKYLEIKCSQTGTKWLQGKFVLELGAGLGCVGLTAACLGAHVTMTDLPEVMPLLQKTIDENKHMLSSCEGSVCNQILHWGKTAYDNKTPDIILLADCVYYEESVEPLIETLCALAASSTEVIISQELRESDKQQHIWEKFYEGLLKFFEVTKIPEEEQHQEFSSPDILVLHAKRRVS